MKSIQAFLYFAAPAACFVIVYSFVAIFVCCEFSDDKARWWCPFCLLFGKRRLP